jgi:CheY-like chemotaxis protein
MAGERLLVVEDNSQNRRLAQFLLISHSYVVDEATTGHEAFELARAHVPPPDPDGPSTPRLGQLRRDQSFEGW